MKDRREKRKKKHPAMKYVAGSAWLAGCLAIGIYSHFGGFGTGTNERKSLHFCIRAARKREKE